ncbi:hypothetical protein TNCV_2774141 [Trichonephila clavipes]|nr:hypothetical protein TNCV_2774141 [Trichonephila clavipes]
MTSTSGYNLRPRKGAKVESQTTIEMKTQQKDQFEPGTAEKSTTEPTSKTSNIRQQEYRKRYEFAEMRQFLWLFVLMVY